MTLAQFAEKHSTTIKHLSEVWGFSYLNLRRYSVAQRYGGGVQVRASARVPSLETRRHLHELTAGKVDMVKDWPVGGREATPE